MGIREYFVSNKDRAFAGDKLQGGPNHPDWSWRGDYDLDERPQLATDEQLYEACRTWYKQRGQSGMTRNEETSIKQQCLTWYRIFCRVGIIDLKE